MRVVIASYLLAVCHALSIADPVVAAQPVESAASLANYEGSDREKRLLEGARKEREVNVYTSLVTEDVTNLAAAFEKKYGVKLRFWRASSENVLQRIASEARASRFDFDLVETNGPELESLHRENLLLPAKSPYDADLIPGAIPRHRAWVGTRLNMFVQAYNTSLVRKDELPKAYQDLRDPKWRGKLGIEAEDSDWFGAVAAGTSGDPPLDGVDPVAGCEGAGSWGAATGAEAGEAVSSAAGYRCARATRSWPGWLPAEKYRLR